MRYCPFKENPIEWDQFWHILILVRHSLYGSNAAKTETLVFVEIYGFHLANRFPNQTKQLFSRGGICRRSINQQINTLVSAKCTYMVLVILQSGSPLRYNRYRRCVVTEAEFNPWKWFKNIFHWKFENSSSAKSSDSRKSIFSLSFLKRISVLGNKSLGQSLPPPPVAKVAWVRDLELKSTQMKVPR